MGPARTRQVIGAKDFGLTFAVAHRGSRRRPRPPWLPAGNAIDGVPDRRGAPHDRHAPSLGDTNGHLAVAVFGAAALAPVFTPSASAADPQLTITDAQVTEGNTGTTDLVFTVRSSASGSRKVTVDYATGGGTATATTDYTPKQGTVTIAAGQRSATIRVPVVGDTAQEPDETVEVRLSKPVRAAIADGLGVGTIVNDDAAPPPPVLTVTPTGTGTGGVVSQPSGISCPNDCLRSPTPPAPP